MTPALIVNGIIAALNLVEALLPQLKSLQSKGEISAEQQQSVLARYQALRDNLEAEFSGPEWTIDPE